MFSSVIPVDHMGLFFDEFFKSKWVFFLLARVTTAASPQARDYKRRRLLLHNTPDKVLIQ